MATYTHTGAGTENVVYFRTGGKKYPLSSPLAPLNASFGPQLLELDLLAGPLAGPARSSRPLGSSNRCPATNCGPPRGC